MKPFNMNLKRTGLMLSLLLVNLSASAAESAPQASSMGSMLKVILGLVVVLAVMALVSWAVKRMIPGAQGQGSVMKIVASTGVGPRERVVVLEIADRWLVVGVASGQVSALANLEIGAPLMINSQTAVNADSTETADAGAIRNAVHPSVSPILQPLVKPFAQFLQKSMLKKSSEKATTKF